LDVRRWLRGRIAKWLVALLIGVQLTPITYACVMPMPDASMAYVDAVMPEACADLPKEACLVAYIQDDRTIGGDGASIASTPAAALSVAVQSFATFAPRGDGAFYTCPHSGAPPPRLMFCRMLE
jgi:hypothetical protein